MIIILICGLLFLMLSVPYLVASVDDYDTSGIFFSVVILLLSISLLCEYSNIEGEKQGQVEVLTGHVKYRLVVNSDSTKTWEEVDDETKK